MSWRIAVQTLPGPSLDLLFTNRSLVDNISGRNLITFTRASSATYVDSNRLIRTAATNEPRFDHNPATGESLGLLIEEQRTNLLTYSEQFDNAYWGKDGTAVTPNAATAPDGTLTAGLLYTITSGIASVYSNLGTVSSAFYTTTVYLKSAGFTWASVYGPQGNISAFFNLIAGTVGTVGAGLTASISSVGNGWYRCSVTQTATYASFYVLPADANGTLTSTASGTSGIFIWGAQLEQGSFPTSYIPTTTAAVTRATDAASITGANFSSWYNQSAGAIFMDYKRSLYVGNGYPIPWIIRDSVPGNYINGILIYGEAGNIYDRLGGTNIETTPAVTLPNPLGRTDKNVATFTNGSLNMAINGTLGTESSSKIYPLGSVNRFIFSPVMGGFTFKRLTYWPARLPNPILRRLTQ